MKRVGQKRTGAGVWFHSNQYYDKSCSKSLPFYLNQFHFIFYFFLLSIVLFVLFVVFFVMVFWLEEGKSLFIGELWFSSWDGVGDNILINFTVKRYVLQYTINYFFFPIRHYWKMNIYNFFLDEGMNEWMNDRCFN